MKLAGKTAIVTGSGSGIGLATAKLLALEGASIVVAEKDEVRGEAARSEISKSGGKCIFVRVDVSKPNDANEMVQEAIRFFGRVDILVNNAAIARFANTMDTTEQIWDEVIATNLKGVFFCSQSVVPEMRKVNGGAIINISSINAVNGPPNQIAYSTAKAGVLGLTVVLAKDLAKYNIRVNAVMPGAIDTPMLRSYLNSLPDAEAETQRLLNKRLLKRFGKPEDVAKAVLFFASDLSEWITGVALRVDGGELLSI